MWFNAFCHAGRWGAFGRFGTWGWIGLILNLVVWVALIAALITFVVWVIRRARVSPASASYAGDQTTSGGANAKQILQARYARGEITREQYQQMLDDLG